MRFTVESWSPEYGAPIEGAARSPEDGPAGDAGPRVNPELERAADAWAPIRGDDRPAARIALIDGVRRIDARLWVTDDAGRVVPGICASYAAGVVSCDGRAEVASIQVERGLFVAGPSAPIRTAHAVYLPRPVEGDDADELVNALQRALREVEIRVAETAGEADLVVIDGSLRGRQHLRSAVGYVKSHWVRYLPEDLSAVVARLEPGERTPLFGIESDWTRYSWYLRLPGGEGHPWAGVVRCEVSGLLAIDDARRYADLTASTLPRFASAPHKDTRAPQNLYPIAGLERELRRRLGDMELLYRGLRVASRA